MAADLQARNAQVVIGLVLESEFLAEAELHGGKLIALFADPMFRVGIIIYFLIRSSSLRNAAEAAVFERWVRSEIEAANLKAVF